MSPESGRRFGDSDMRENNERKRMSPESGHRFRDNDMRENKERSVSPRFINRRGAKNEPSVALCHGGYVNPS